MRRLVEILLAILIGQAVSFPAPTADGPTLERSALFGGVPVAPTANVTALGIVDSSFIVQRLMLFPG